MENALNSNSGNRFRLFAGPNGSGKSTIFRQIDKDFDIGYYVNADDIENQLGKSNFIDLKNFGLENSSSSKFQSFLKSHSLVEKAIKEGYKIDVFLEKGKIINPSVNTHSYEAAFISDFLRAELIKSNKKITCETVMSHPSKLDLLDFSNSKGYKNYLYFICTSSPKINIERVNLRVKQGGHSVNEEKIIQRYYRSLTLLREATKKTYRTFVWDNSGEEPKLILEVFKGYKVTYLNKDVPYWVDKYLLKS